MKLYKFMFAGSALPWGAATAWPQPALGTDGNWTAGAWLPELVGPLRRDVNGYHLAPARYIVAWLAGSQLYEAESFGDHLRYRIELVCRQARLVRPVLAWDEAAAGLCACDCAEAVLPIWERETGDQRYRALVETTRRYINGEATAEQLYQARLDAKRVRTVRSFRIAGNPSDELKSPLLGAYYTLAPLVWEDGLRMCGGARYAAKTLLRDIVAAAMADGVLQGLDLIAVRDEIYRQLSNRLLAYLGEPTVPEDDHSFSYDPSTRALQHN